MRGEAQLTSYGQSKQDDETQKLRGGWHVGGTRATLTDNTTNNSNQQARSCMTFRGGITSARQRSRLELGIAAAQNCQKGITKSSGP